MDNGGPFFALGLSPNIRGCSRTSIKSNDTVFFCLFECDFFGDIFTTASVVLLPSFLILPFDFFDVAVGDDGAYVVEADFNFLLLLL